MQALRTEDLFKKPGVAETIDWAKCLLALDVISLSPEVIADTLGAILKYQDDIARMQGSEAKRILDEVRAAWIDNGTVWRVPAAAPQGKGRRAGTSALQPAARVCKLTSNKKCRRQGARPGPEAASPGRMRMTDEPTETQRQAALDYHEFPKPGKLEIRATKPMANGRDLARAYSPGVAEACLEIKADPRPPAATPRAATSWRWSPMAAPCSGWAISARWRPSR